MYRYGSRENHSYPLGAYSTPEAAHLQAEIEEQGRGGKYIAEILSCEIDGKLQDIVKGLPGICSGCDDDTCNVKKNFSTLNRT